ncbi:MAG: DNA mismatch repair protein MutS [Bacteroidaceae bacterium]|nr:DNA mismatch repair protein MutS [Bacteroidaceae bacterium]
MGEKRLNLVRHYQACADKLGKEIVGLGKKGPLFLVGELLSFISFLVLAFFALYEKDWLMGGESVCSLITYLVIRYTDQWNDAQIDDLTRHQQTYLHEISYLQGDFNSFDEGSEFVDASHPFTFDLDVFGKDSLFNRICRTVTPGGKRMLAESLMTLPKASELDFINRKREAIDELAQMEPLRVDFLSVDSRKAFSQTGADGSLSALNDAKVLSHPSILYIADLLILGFWVTVFLSVFTPLPANVPITWGLLHIVLMIAFCAKPLKRTSVAIGKLHGEMKAYATLVNLLQQTSFKASYNQELYQRLFADKANASVAFRQLTRILDSIDRRGNEVAMLVFNVCWLNDYFIIRRYRRWQRLYADEVGMWIETVSRFDALISMATFRANEPDAGRAELADNPDEVVYEGKGLWHPFLGARAVRNDFTILNNHYYIVTGANMAGKSTFLRTIGMNCLLAMNGMPVFATSLKVSLFNLFTSMRTTDDLSRGISYFNAELLRLQQLMDSCRQHHPTLIILDEILKGTNSADKLGGSRLFLQTISRQPVTGIIATHDLALSQMADEYPDRFHCWCFEIELGTDVTYSYRITPGVAKNQNATYLLRQIICAEE